MTHSRVGDFQFEGSFTQQYKKTPGTASRKQTDFSDPGAGTCRKTPKSEIDSIS